MRPLAPALAILAAMSPVAAWAQQVKAADEEASALEREAAPAPPAPPVRQPSSGFLVGAVVQGDIVFMPGGEPCSRESQSSVTYACFRADREQYLGVPVPGARAPFSAAYGTTRVEVHVERAIVNNLTIGGRFGIALGGGPAPAKGPGFLPLHFEARAAYWFGHPPSIDTGLQGFVFLMGGAAQVDASRVVDVQECRAGSTSGCVPADNIQPGSPNPDHQTLRAYKKAGEVFIGAGLGAYYSFIRGSGIALELKAMQLLPSFGTTLSPSLSYVFFVP